MFLHLRNLNLYVKNNSFISEVSSTKASPLKQRAMETSNHNNSTELSGNLQMSTVSHDSRGAARIDGEERHWTDTLKSLDREVSPEKASPEGASQLHRHIENAFSSTTEIENGSHGRDENFMEGTVCQELLSELSRCVGVLIKRTSNLFQMLVL